MGNRYLSEVAKEIGQEMGYLKNLNEDLGEFRSESEFIDGIDAETIKKDIDSASTNIEKTIVALKNLYTHMGVKSNG